MILQEYVDHWLLIQHVSILDIQQNPHSQQLVYDALVINFVGRPVYEKLFDNFG